MATPVEMPKLGNTVEECFLTAWRKSKGDAIAAGEVIAEIETDKTTFELTAPVDGVLLETFFDAGALIPVFTTVCVVGAEGESVEAFRPGGTPAATRGATPPAPVPGSNGSPIAEAPEGDALASGVGRLPAVAVGLEAGDRLSPRARRFSRERDFHPQSVAGTGPGGRILEADLRDVFHASPRPGESLETAERQPVPASAGSAIEAVPRPPDVPLGGQRLSMARGTIARRLRECLSSTAQYTLHSSADAGPLLALRRRLKAASETRDISIGDLMVFCTVQALLEVPELNAELIEGILYPHAEVHMAFACDTPRGLVVPVVRDSQNLSLRGLSGRIKELAALAVQGMIDLDDLSGGTFTISNLGSLGIESFTPVLNPPQVAILGVDAIQLKPVRKADGNIEFIDAIGLSLTVDHQVIDGAPGARFLRTLTSKIEIVETLCTI